MDLLDIVKDHVKNAPNEFPYNLIRDIDRKHGELRILCSTATWFWDIDKSLVKDLNLEIPAGRFLYFKYCFDHLGDKTLEQWDLRMKKFKTNQD